MEIKDGTLTNLRSAGYKGKYGLSLQPANYAQDSKIPYKSGARKQIEQRVSLPALLREIGFHETSLAYHRRG